MMFTVASDALELIVTGPEKGTILRKKLSVGSVMVSSTIVTKMHCWLLIAEPTVKVSRSFVSRDVL